MEAQKIAEILNEDFKNVMGRLQDIRSASARPGDVGSNFSSASSTTDAEEGGWVEGTTNPGDIEQTTSKENETKTKKMGRPDPKIGRRGSPNEDGMASVDPAGGTGQKSRKPRGGFNVEYRNLGEDSDRSKYDDLRILINLDHLVVRNALRSGGVEDPSFRRLSYEIAFAEYSIALAYEMAKQDPDFPADDLIYEVRTTLNRVSVSAASLYS